MSCCESVRSEELFPRKYRNDAQFICLFLVRLNNRKASSAFHTADSTLDTRFFYYYLCTLTLNTQLLSCSQTGHAEKVLWGSATCWRDVETNILTVPSKYEEEISKQPQKLHFPLIKMPCANTSLEIKTLSHHLDWKSERDFVSPILVSQILILTQKQE